MNKHECATRTKKLTQARCGLAFVEYLLRDERLKATKSKVVHKVDLQTGFSTAASALYGIGTDECQKLSKIARANAKNIGGKGKLDRKEIGRLRIRNRASLMAAKIDEMISAVEKACMGEAKVGSSCGCRR